MKRYPTKNYKLWLEKSESTVATDEINIYKVEEKLPKVQTQSNQSNKTKNENKLKKKNKMKKDKIEEKVPELTEKI